MEVREGWGQRVQLKSHQEVELAKRAKITRETFKIFFLKFELHYVNWPPDYLSPDNWPPIQLVT